MPKRVPPLSARRVATMAPGEELIDGQVPGLRVRKSNTGRLAWSLNIRDAKGKRRRFEVTQGLGLANARTLAEDVRTRVKRGEDPTKERRVARERANSAKEGLGTFNSVLDSYFGSGRGKTLATAGEQLSRIRSVFAAQLDRPALDISPSDLQRCVDAYPAAVSAARAVGYVRPVLRWAGKRELVQRGFHELEKPIEPRQQRVLSRDELKLILPHLDDEYGRAARFLLLTAVRLREATEARWIEFDLHAGTWTIVAARRKDTRSFSARNGGPTKSLTIPLSRQAREIVHALPAANADALVFRGERGGALVNWDRWLKRIFDKSGTRSWSAHALRRTAATMAGELGTPPHIVQVMLGHRNIGGQLHAGYNQSRYSNEHATALQQLADHIDNIIVSSKHVDGVQA